MSHPSARHELTSALHYWSVDPAAPPAALALALDYIYGYVGMEAVNMLRTPTLSVIRASENTLALILSGTLPKEECERIGIETDPMWWYGLGIKHKDYVLARHIANIGEYGHSLRYVMTISENEGRCVPLGLHEKRFCIPSDQSLPESPRIDPLLAAVYDALGVSP